MRSLYRRQLAMMVSIMLVSFTLLAGAFMLLSYRYIIGETRDSVERNAGYISSFTATYYRRYLTLDVQDEFYSSYMASIAMISNSHIIVADSGGKVLFSTDGSHFYTQENGQLPEDIVAQVMEGGAYNGMTNLGGIFQDRRYTAALPVANQVGPLLVTQGMVLVGASASNLNEMWASTATIFFFSAVVVFLISVIASTLTSAYQTRPLNEMAEAARRFGQGEFDTRVTGYEDRCDEVSALAEAFNSMANSLEKVESQRAEFIANVSHELKTPMTTIAGFAEGILDGTIPQERERESLQIVVSETRRLSRLVRRMLDLSRLNALTQSTVTAQEAFDFTEVMSQVLISLETKITDRQLDVDVRMPKGKLMVWGDPDAVTQVCYNLLDNAAKFAAPGTAITVQIVKKDGKAHTTIRNLGGTIPPEELPLLFERFHKADYSRSMDREGVGLGLYIVKTILGNLKENITVTSEDGVTQFQFTLTLA
ncbi:MAG: HAMP domain-containing histidine kinase [Lawsonibacter sp.]|jgi:signal transduction histidine kinase|nr:HAMP domain-containing histidine kinase [Lawsonibacter sp.]MCI9027749.1 HAMP domain-containing histidine kinase [Lawsonibacter sp.]MCI9295297.1 HAMP domain-containing histidine kinase [Lawsonibacter sp.]MCI9654770.1 HAMP domain-containing histidine kinase [Lawsonibacter sp.]